MINTAILDTALHLVILIPFFLIAKQSNNNNFNYKPVLYFIIVYLTSNILIYSLSNISIFNGQQYNWTGKGAALAFLLICSFIIPTFSSKQFAITSKVLWAGTKPILAICFVYLLVRIWLYAFSGEASSTIHPEAVLFQSTLPGFQEELLFRSILLGLLSRVFPKPSWKFAKVEFGWPVIMTSILFGLAHGLYLNNNFNLDINYFNLLRTTFDGFLFALLVQKTKSIIPGIIYHNLLNLISNH